MMANQSNFWYKLYSYNPLDLPKLLKNPSGTIMGLKLIVVIIKNYSVHVGINGILKWP